MGSSGTSLVNKTSYVRPSTFSFSRVLNAIDADGNGKIDVRRDIELLDTDKDGKADTAIPLNGKRTGRFLRFGSVGKDEIGDYLRKVAKLDFIMNFDEPRVFAQISKDLGISISAQEIAALRTRYDAKSAYVLVSSLTQFVEKKLAALDASMIRYPDLKVQP